MLTPCQNIFQLFCDQNESKFETQLLNMLDRVGYQPEVGIDIIAVSRRCLKLSRSSAHPERLVGKACNVATEYHADLHNSMTRLLLRTIQDHIDVFFVGSFNCKHFSFFLLSLILDVLKECSSVYDLRVSVFLEKTMQWLLATMEELVTYIPNLLRILDIIKVISKSKEELYGLSKCISLALHFMRVLISQYRTKALFEYGRNVSLSTGSGSCSLIDDSALLCNTGPIVCVLLSGLLLKSLKGVRRILSPTDCDHKQESTKLTENAPKILAILEDVEDLSQVLEDVIRSQHSSVRSFVRSMCVDDKELVALCLGVTEIACEFDALKCAAERILNASLIAEDQERLGQSDLDANPNTTQTKLISAITSGLDKVRAIFSTETGLGMYCLFVHFLSDAMCFDASACVDLITQTETDSLQFFLLVMRCLCACEDPRDVLLQACRKCWLEQSRDGGGGQDTADTSRDTEQERWEEGDHSCTGHVIMWKKSEEIIPKHAQSDQAENTVKDIIHSSKRRKHDRCEEEGHDGGDAQVESLERVHEMEWRCGRHKKQIRNASKEVVSAGDLEGGFGSGENLLEATLEFLSELRDDLQGINIQGLITFDCSPLVRRMSAAIDMCRS